MKNQKLNKTFFVSDVHLSHKHPEILTRFQDFLKQKAVTGNRLYILGDLFEYWLGDDAVDDLSRQVAQDLSTLADTGTRIYYMHGNRDFLIGEEYAKQCQFSLLEDPVEHTLYDQSWLLTHGDALCTDDTEYQKVRSMVRTQQWQQYFLSKSIQERIAFADKARQESAQHTQQASLEIMDVNGLAVERLLTAYPESIVIHGHTHRPAVHSSGGRQRIVLGDWYSCNSYLEISTAGFQLINGEHPNY